MRLTAPQAAALRSLVERNRLPAFAARSTITVLRAAGLVHMVHVQSLDACITPQGTAALAAFDASKSA